MKLVNEIIEMLNEGIDFKTIKDNKIKLTDEERDKCMKEKATWNSSSNPTCAIWKADINGKIVYGCNTHRAFDYASTLDGAIKIYHENIKDTA